MNSFEFDLPKQPQKQDKFDFSIKQKKKINEVFSANGMDNLSAESFLSYARKAIEFREYAKFVFTKIVSSSLDVIANFAQDLKIEKEDISHLSIDEVIGLTNAGIQRIELGHTYELINKRKYKFKLDSKVTLPLLIFDPENMLIAPFFTNQPNFITQKQVTGESIVISEMDNQIDLTGKIVLIESADPGYDWIFSFKISALITKFGGVNSHMSIRCAEFEIPSAIGCGPVLFDKLTGSSIIMLDCGSAQITKVK